MLHRCAAVPGTVRIHKIAIGCPFVFIHGTIGTVICAGGICIKIIPLSVNISPAAFHTAVLIDPIPLIAALIKNPTSLSIAVMVKGPPFAVDILPCYLILTGYRVHMAGLPGSICIAIPPSFFILLPGAGAAVFSIAHAA